MENTAKAEKSTAIQVGKKGFSLHGSGLASLPDGNANAVDVTFRTVIIIIIIMVKGLTVLEEVAVDG